MLIWQIFKNHISEHNLVRPEDKILLAVSGGADSMVMADLFSRLQKTHGFELVIVNFNHNLRKESEKETTIVEKFAEKRKIKFISKHLNTKDFASSLGISLETAGRQLRYDNLELIAKTEKCNKIATAHNMNDQAETILMWIIRGTGADGLSGIPVIRKINDKITVIRPLLAVKRELIEEYAKKQKIKFCMDKSNFSTDFTRNKIRLTLMPEIKKINSLATEHIFELSKITSRENAYFDKKISDFYKKNVRISPDKIVMKIKPFSKTDISMQYRILRKLTPVKKDSGHINMILKLARNSKQSSLVLSKHWTVLQKKDVIVFTKK